MIDKPELCKTCVGWSWGCKGYVPASGSGENGVLIVAEAAGENEANEGMPLVGKAGHFFFSNLKRAGIDREGFRVHNVLSCKPFDNKLSKMPYEMLAIEHCSPLLDATIADMQNMCQNGGKQFTILTLGRIAFKRIMGLDDKDPILREDYLCYPFWSDKYGAWVIAVDHPSYLMRGNSRFVPLMQYAATRAIEIAQQGLKQEDYKYYLLDPEPQTFAQWVQDYEHACLADPSNTFLSFDIETPYKKGRNEDEVVKEEDDDYTILRISFCYKPGFAISVPWTAEYLPWIEEIFSFGGQKIGWNSENYDVPRITARMPIYGDRHDGMLCWHVLNSALDKGLGFVSPFYAKTLPMWKHLSASQPALYNAIDSDAALQCFLGIRDDLIKNGQWKVYEKHVTRLNKALSYMSDKGVLLDQEGRNKAEKELQDILDIVELKMESAIPKAVQTYKVFKRTPKDVSDMVQVKGTTTVKACPRCAAQNVSIAHFKSIGKKRLKAGEAENPCTGLKAIKVSIDTLLWAKPLPFKVSKKSLTSYQGVLRHQAIFSRKEQKVTFDEAAIVRLMKKYPNDRLYPLILEHREVGKLLGTYIGVTQENGKIKGGMPFQVDGRVHTTYTHNPSTLRLASQNPNLQNIPRPGSEEDLCSIIRNLFIASPGCKLYARDYCVGPTSKILKADLTWESAENINIGDELIAFDEDLLPKKGVGKGLRAPIKFKLSTVTAVRRLNRPKIKVTTTKGVTVVSDEHRFIARYKSYKRKWVEAKNLRPGMLMPFLSSPWEPDLTREGGYLAGFLDGEGYAHRTNVGFGQNEGPVLHTVIDLLKTKGFKFTQHGRGQKCSENVHFQYACISGIGEQLRLLGTLRPVRLLPKAINLWEGRQISSKCSLSAEVLSVEPLDDGDVIAIETTSATFISDGYFSHNCGIEAVLVGYFACDPSYIRLAKMDVHSYYTAYALNQLDGRVSSADLPQLSWPDEKLIPHLAAIKKEFKKDRNELYKHLVHGCVTGDHEVLTPNGWTRFDALKEGVSVAQWNKDGTIEFVMPSRVVRQEWSGDLIKWEGQSLSLSMTPDHRIPIINSCRSLKCNLAEDPIKPFERIPSTGVLKSRMELAPELIQLLVAIQADATLCGNHVIFHLVRSRKIARLTAILNELRIQYSYTECRCHKTGIRIGFNMKNLGISHYLEPDKTFNLAALLELDQPYRKIFLDELSYWDGCRGGTSGKQTCYMSTNLTNVQCVQTIAHVSGMRSLIKRRKPGALGTKPVYRASLAQRKYISLEGIESTIQPYNGMVYCVTVPSGWFLVRHNNKISVTGNSNFLQGPMGAKEKIFKETRIDYPVSLVSKVMGVYFELFPLIKRWHHDLLLQAEKDGFLRNPFGYVHRFSSVFSYKKEFGEWKKEPGGDSNKVIAFLPQSTAAGIIKEAIMRLFFDRFEEAGQFLRLQIHDEIMLEPLESLLDQVDKIVKEEMEKPIKALPLPKSYGMGDYLVINTEAKMGDRWGSMRGFGD